MANQNILSKDLIVAMEIYKYSDNKTGREEPIFFSKLVVNLEGKVSRSTISKSIDRLFDLGIIDGSWEKVDSRWTRVFKISGEASSLIGALYESQIEPGRETPK